MMELLREKILNEGILRGTDVLKIDSFLNHRIDIDVVTECANEWYKLFKDESITKIMTVEASGIGLACVTAQLFKVPVVFAKKTKSPKISDEFYSAKVVSFTHGQSYQIIAAKKFISADDKILIVDDFLSNGSALKALISLAKSAGAEVVGTGIAIEKTFMNGGNDIRKMGYRVESLAKISSIKANGEIVFE